MLGCKLSLGYGETYTFYCVRWATQKRDILRVCVQKWPIGGGYPYCHFCVCASHLKWPIIFFSLVFFKHNQSRE